MRVDYVSGRRASAMAAAALLSAAVSGTVARSGFAAPPAKRVSAATAAAPGGGPFSLGRANLAQAATFTVTQTISPKGGTLFSRAYKIAVKGKEARADFSDPNTGAMRFLANEKGVFSYLPDTQTAVKQNVKGGVEEALQLAFASVQAQLKGARKVGTATVSGQPTTIYRSADGTATVYWGERPGFKLPVKVVQTNAGGTTTTLVTDIKLNPAGLTAATFAIPAGARIMDDASGGGAPPLPGR